MVSTSIRKVFGRSSCLFSNQRAWSSHMLVCSDVTNLKGQETDCRRIWLHLGSSAISNPAHRGSQHCAARQPSGRAGGSHGAIKLLASRRRQVRVYSPDPDESCANDPAATSRQQSKSRRTSASRCRSSRPLLVGSTVRPRPLLQSWTRPWASWTEEQRPAQDMG